MRTLLALILLAAASLSQTEPPKSEAPKPDASGLMENPTWKPLKYRLAGPAWGGRVSRAAGIAGDPFTYYFGAAGSGVWKSVDGGTSWKPVFDSQPVSSIGALAISPSEPNVVYVGSGEANIRGNVAAGNGIYKTVDGGKTWNHVWKQEGQIGTMAVHPGHPNIAYAAVLGKAFGPNPERGIYRTRDGGKTWNLILKKDADTGASDIAMDPSNPNILFAGMWETRRSPWDLKSGGPGSGLYVSRDAGDTWKQLTEKGLPKGIWGKVGVAVAPSDSRRVYALIEAAEGGLFRSDDGGDTWTRISASRAIRQRAWYYTTLTVHPTNPNEVWVPSVPMLKSIDGGATWKYVKGISHGDHHDVWFDPRNPKRIIVAQDAGVDVSTDGGETWYAPALPISQFYHVSTDSRIPFSIAGAMQDIGTAQGPSDSLAANGIRNTDWYRVGGGEAGHVVSDPTDPNIVYAGEYGGTITFYDHRSRQARNVSAYPENPSGHGAEDMQYRYQWTAPITVSPHNPKVIYHGAQVVFRTADGGQTWTPISGDLTRNDKSKQKWAGGPITGDNTGVEVYCTVFAIAESPLQKDLLWTGSDDGLVHISTDAGKNWKNVTPNLPGLPMWATIRVIEPSRFAAGTAYLVADNHRNDDNRPYLYRTTDFGASWTRLDSTLDPAVYLHVVREDPSSRNVLYVGTERGVGVSLDGGSSWQSLRLNLPTVAVHDLALRNDSLVVATMGRSLWLLDHLTPIRESLRLYAPDAVAWRRDRRPADKFAGDNPPNGAAIYYYLTEAPKDDLKLEILDAQGRVLRTLSSKPETPFFASDNPEGALEAAKKAALPKEKGMNRGTWDLRFQGATLAANAKIDMGDPDRGPLVPAGIYTVRLTADGKTETTTLKVANDPRVPVSEADRKAQVSSLLEMRDSMTRLSRMITDLKSVQKQLATRNDLLRENTRFAELTKDSAALLKKLEALEARMHNSNAEVVYDILAFQGGTKLYSRLAWLYDQANDSDGPITQGVREVYASQKKELAQYESDYKKLLDSDVVSLNLAAKKLDAPVIVLPVY